MIKSNLTKHFRVLAVAPTTRGFGYVVFEDGKSLVDWGVKTAAGDKNAKSLKSLEKFLTDCHPSSLVLEDVSVKGSRRSSRIRALSQEMIALAVSKNVKVALLTRKRVREEFFGASAGTKQEIAERLAFRFPDELRDRLPPKRRAWNSESARMGIFDAMALACVFFQTKEKRKRKAKP